MSFYSIKVVLLKYTLLSITAKLFFFEFEETFLFLKLHEQLNHLVIDLHFSKILIKEHGIIEASILIELL